MRTPFDDIPEIENPSLHIGMLCHVKGWNKGGVFILKSFNNGVATLRTPKTGKIFMTKNALIYTQKQWQAIRHDCRIYT